jgi:AraC-like DNA-binding protein
MLAVIALAGAVAALLVAGTALAQAPPGSDQQAKTGYHEFFLDRLAGLLGVSRASLDDALKQARSDTVDQAVQDGRISPERAERLKSREGFRMGPGFAGPRGGEAGRAVVAVGAETLDVVADALGMTRQELVAELRSGKTLAELVAGREDAVRDALVTAAEARLAQAVAAGRMTQEQADRMLDRIRSLDLSQLGRLGGMSWPGMREGRDWSGMKEGRDWSGMRRSLERFRELRPSGSSAGLGASAL